MLSAWLSLKHTCLQFWSLFGIFLIGGAILTLLSRLTNNTFNQFCLPRLGLYAFGWLGVPVHELSHAIFCKLFLHEIRDVKWFDTRAKNGAHGSVTHLYNPWNLYHRIGHFFIGLGPAILGPVFLAFLFYVLVPSGRGLVHSGLDGGTWLGVTTTLFKILSQPIVLKSPLFYLFLYFAICVSSQIELSPEDLKQVVTGLFPIALVLWLINVFAWATHWNWHAKALHFGNVIFSLFTAMFAFASVVALLNLVICTVVMGLINRLSGRPFINPLVTLGSTGES